jgi:hypothetical protein
LVVSNAHVVLEVQYMSVPDARNEQLRRFFSANARSFLFVAASALRAGAKAEVHDEETHAEKLAC